MTNFELNDKEMELVNGGSYEALSQWTYFCNRLKAGEKEEAKEYFYSLVEKGALSAENQTVWREAYRLYTHEEM